MVIAAIASILLVSATAQVEKSGSKYAMSLTFETLLTEMVNRSVISSLPVHPYTCKQMSSYDRASTSPADAEKWFANGDNGQYLRTITVDGRSEHVMFDADGPGAVVRIWSANPAGTLRIYVDGSEKPALEGSMQDVLGGKGPFPTPLAAERSRGFNLYAPIPYRKHCMITTDGKGGIYYQVNYRTYSSDQPVESFAAETVARSGEAISRVCKELNAPLPDVGMHILKSQTIPVRGSHTHTMPAGPGVLTHLSAKLEAKNRSQALRSTVIQIQFDGERTVWCPLGELFAMGPGVAPYATWWTNVEADGTMHLLFPMPYMKDAIVTLQNLGDEPVKVSLGATFQASSPDDGWMHFHAAWRDQYPIHTRPMQDWNYVTVTGTGVYVGDSLSLMNPVPDWWGEGDEKIYVDGEKFPSHFGTGTEDYYSYAWSSPKTFAGPFNAQPRCDGEAKDNTLGRTTVMRTRSLDAIPFKGSLKFDMEVWHWKECDVEYAATTYFYAKPGAVVNIEPDPEGAARTLVVPPPPPPPKKVENAVEFEEMQVAAATDMVGTEVQNDFSPGLWSGGKQLWVRAKQVGDFIELTAKAPDKKPHVLSLYATRSWDYGIVQVYVNGVKAGEPINLCSGENAVKATGSMRLGEFTPENGGYSLKFEIVAIDPKAAAPKTYLGLDCLVIDPAAK